MRIWGKETVSISEILLVLNGGPPANVDPEAAKIGKIVHKDIETKANEGILPPGLRRLGIGTPVKAETRHRRQIEEGLNLSAQVDLETPDFTVDLKPGREIQGRHLLQAVVSTVARGEKGVKSAVYLYQTDQVHVVNGSNDQIVEPILQMGRDARIVLDNQDRLKAGGMSPGERHILGEQSWKAGERVRANRDKIMKDILSRRTKI